MGRLPRSEDAIHPALRTTIALLRARKGSPVEADHPRHRRRPRLPQPLPGQLDIFGRVHGDDRRDEEAQREQGYDGP
jgi:hypothetical protein